MMFSRFSSAHLLLRVTVSISVVEYCMHDPALIYVVDNSTSTHFANIVNA
jgi:hypothetical protein